MHAPAQWYSNLVTRFDPSELLIRDIHDPEKVRHWLEQGADPNRRGRTGLSAVQVLLQHERPTTRVVLALLLQKGVDLAQRTHENHYTPLLQAASACQTEVARLLLQHGAEVNARGFNGITPLMLAAVRLDPELCELLIAHGADVNASDDQGQHLLEYVYTEPWAWHVAGEPLWSDEAWRQHHPAVEAVLLGAGSVDPDATPEP